MKVFVSYSSRDRQAVQSLSRGLQDAEEEVWMDQRLAGGDAWWRAILDQIRGCDVFVFALSQNSIQSKPCQAEVHYAQALGLPILPVQVGPVDSMQLNPLATVQSIDYRSPTPTAAMQLIAALHRTRAHRQPLPSPLPDEPPVPFEYLMRLYTTIAGPDQLGPHEQAALVAQLQVGLREDGGHDAARNDIVMLLGKLRDREDVTYRTRTDVEAILASIDAGSPPRSPIVADTAAHAEGYSGATRPAEGVSATAGDHQSDAPPPLPTSTPQTREPLTGTRQITGGPPRTPPHDGGQRRVGAVALPSGQVASLPRRVGAALIDLIPILIAYGIAYGIAVGTAKTGCYSSVNGEFCRLFRSAQGDWAIRIALIVALAYAIWNWGYRQGRTGSTVGMSVLKLKMVNETGQPAGFTAGTIVTIVGTLAIALLLAWFVSFTTEYDFLGPYWRAPA